MAKTKIIKTIEAGQLREAVIYTPPRKYDTQQQRAQRSKVTSKAQAASNKKHQVKRLEYLIAANFEQGDRFVTLTYRDSSLPKNRKEARRQLRDAIAQIRAAYKMAGYDLKYIYTTEDKHGDGRIHHHLIISAAPGDIEILRSLWPYGEIDVETLAKYGANRAQELAIYMLKERKPNGEQGYTCAKVMTQPVIKTEWIDEDCTLTAPRGAVILEEGKEVTEWAEYYHLKYIRPAPMAAPQPGSRRDENQQNNQPGQRAPFSLETGINFRKNIAKSTLPALQ